MPLTTKYARVKKRYPDLYIKINSSVMEVITLPSHN